jgi:hypothetical protein
MARGTSDAALPESARLGYRNDHAETRALTRCPVCKAAVQVEVTATTNAEVFPVGSLTTLLCGCPPPRPTPVPLGD